MLWSRSYGGTSTREVLHLAQQLPRAARLGTPRLGRALRAGCSRRALGIEAKLVRQLQEIIHALAAQVNEMAAVFAPPEPVRWGPGVVFRHTEQTDALAAVLKLVKLVSTLNAAAVLLEHGCVQEVGALCRVAHECSTDILLLSSVGEADADNTERLLADFYREEYEDPERPLSSHIKRDNVPRRKVNAAIARSVSDQINPSDAQAVFGVPEKVLSGYVHGAYPHVMELYGGPDRQFHMLGMLGTPRITEWHPQIVTYLYRALTLSVLVAQLLGLDDVRDRIASLRNGFEEEFGCKPSRALAEQLCDIK